MSLTLLNRDFAFIKARFKIQGYFVSREQILLAAFNMRKVEISVIKGGA